MMFMAQASIMIVICDHVFIVQPAAYFAFVSDEEKCFLTLPPGVNVTKLFSFIPEDKA